MEGLKSRYDYKNLIKSGDLNPRAFVDFYNSYLR